MKVKILNKDDIRENVPIEIDIEGAKGKPQIFVKKLGKVDALAQKNGYKATFWTTKKGTYKITIKDQVHTITKNIIVEEQSYITFKQEFGFFLLIFSFVSIGLIIWMKRLKKIKN